MWKRVQNLKKTDQFDFDGQKTKVIGSGPHYNLTKYFISKTFISNISG